MRKDDGWCWIVAIALVLGVALGWATYPHLDAVFHVEECHGHP